MKDPAFLAAAKKCCVDLNPASHEVVAGRGRSRDQFAEVDAGAIHQGDWLVNEMRGH